MTDTAYGDLSLHRLKKIEIVLLAEDHAMVEELLKAFVEYAPGPLPRAYSGR